MAMDVFSGQTEAKRWTWLMVVLFTLGVFMISIPVIIGIFHFLSLVIFKALLPPMEYRSWLAPLAFLTALSLLAATAWQNSLELRRGGGEAIAGKMGGVPVARNTTDPGEHKLLNVVEEISVASGLPVPMVYVLNQEQGINAFAAGFTPHTAVLGVTRGALELLTREELQGLVAHEFAHILCGDMAFNTRLMGYVLAITFLAQLGVGLKLYAFFILSPKDLSRDADNPASTIIFFVFWVITLALWLVLGLPLLILGSLGTFFANCIKAAVSRNKEMAADTMAVRLTRNPSGLAGALKKIGGFESGSRVRHRWAALVSHMLFDHGARQGRGLLRTHPPLAKRIRRLDPYFDMQFPVVDEALRQVIAAQDAGVMFGHSPPNAPAQEAVMDPAAQARAIIDSLPPLVREVTRDPHSAQAVIHALLIQHDPRRNDELLRLFQGMAPPATHDRVAQLLPGMAQVPDNARLALIDLCIPALRRMSKDGQRQFMELNRYLITSDNRMDPMEWALWKLLTHHLLGRSKAAMREKGPKVTSMELVRRECAVLLYVLSRLGRPDAEERRRAFEAGARALDLEDLQLPDKAERNLGALDKAFHNLDRVDTPYKDKLLRACARCVTSDLAVTAEQGEVLRVVADLLDRPVPPFLPGQPLIQSTPPLNGTA